MFVYSTSNYVPSSLIVPGDAAATGSNIVANESLFRIGMVGQSAMFLTEIVLPSILYGPLKRVNRTLSLIAASTRLATAVVQGINLLSHLTDLLLLSGADYLAVFRADQLQALVLLSLNAHNYVALIWGVFFGLHLIFLGYLVYKSGYIPRIVGALLTVASVCYPKLWQCSLTKT